jgi:hypothetical protein
MTRRHKCKWIPLSFVFETQLLDPNGRVQIRQPNTDKGRVYCVCMGCHQHTYIETKWAGYYIRCERDCGSPRGGRS